LPLPVKKDEKAHLWLRLHAGRSPVGQLGRSPPFRPPPQFFSPFFGDRDNRPAPAVDYSKAPPPRKLETPPSNTVVVIGDSLADWLAYGMDEFYTDQPEIGVERKIAATSGLIRYDAKNDHLDWWQVQRKSHGLFDHYFCDRYLLKHDFSDHNFQA